MVTPAELWSNAAGTSLERDGSDLNVVFTNFNLRFVEAPH